MQSYSMFGFLLCAQVSQMYDDTKLLMTAEPVKDYIPYSWVSMATVKAQYYMALAHTHMATAIIEFAGEWERTLKSCQHNIFIILKACLKIKGA